jgi:hypothetical protein
MTYRRGNRCDPLAASIFAAGNSVISPPAGGRGLSSVEISPDLNCSMTIPDDSQGEFFGDTACATLVSALPAVSG